MALTYRQTKGTALTIEELDANFQYFTGSHSITGSLTIAGTSSLIDFENGSTIQPSGSTLQINPNINLGTDQYIILDPTAPNHIHIRAGGAIDSSSAHLYLGGEKANVLITDSNHQVQINTTAADSSSFTWTFGTDGTTTIPDILQLTVRITDPASPVEGMIMASGSAGSSKLYYYDGSVWVNLIA